MKIDTDSELWDRMFTNLRADLMDDPDFWNNVQLTSAIEVYEVEMFRRGITMIRSKISYDENSLQTLGSYPAPIWSHVEIPDENYLSIILRWQ